MSVPTVPDEPGPVGTPPKVPGKIPPPALCPPGPKGLWRALGGGDREANGDELFFLLKKQKGDAVLTLVIWAGVGAGLLSGPGGG